MHADEAGDHLADVRWRSAAAELLASRSSTLALPSGVRYRFSSKR